MILVAALLLVSRAEESRTHASAAENPGCAVSIAYVERVVTKQNGHKIVFTESDEDLAGALRRGSWQPSSAAIRDPAPSAPLLGALVKQGGASALRKCPSIRAFLDRRRIAYGAKAVQAAIRLQDDGGFRAEILGVSLAMLDPAGADAVLASSAAAGPEGGAGFLHHLRRNPAGSWIVIGSSGLWIS